MTLLVEELAGDGPTFPAQVPLDCVSNTTFVTRVVPRRGVGTPFSVNRAGALVFEEQGTYPTYKYSTSCEERAPPSSGGSLYPAPDARLQLLLRIADA